jgi:hypothetical protein
MASHLNKRLDRLERLIRERTVASTHRATFQTASIQLRFVLVKRVYAPEREEETLPEAPREAGG